VTAQPDREHSGAVADPSNARGRSLLKSASAILGVALATASPASHPTIDRYAEGQVWEYRTRPEDKGSLLKIQKIELLPSFSEKNGPVYHVSIIGLHFTGTPLVGALQHAPFSRASLDASVTKLSPSKATFPDVEAGIKQWRQAKGGVFTITVAEAVSFTQQVMQQQIPPDHK
jgi:hypothetical protein